MRNESFYDKVSIALGMACGIFSFLTAVLLICGLQDFNIVNISLAMITGPIALMCYVAGSKMYRKLKSHQASVKRSKKDIFEYEQAWNSVTKLLSHLSKNEVDFFRGDGVSHASFERLMCKSSQSGARKIINEVANYHKYLSVRHEAR
jgi:predicted amino acid-binding ACT domain protein